MWNHYKNQQKLTQEKTKNLNRSHINTIIEQKILVNNSLHVIGQQLDRIEEKVEKPISSIKTEKPLIDLPGQRQNLSLKTTQTKTIEKVEQMLYKR